MAKKDKADRKSFEDMSAEREAEVKAGIEAASDRMADAQGDAMLANIGRRIDEVKGEEERKRNYHLLQASAIRENEKRRMENTAVNVGEPPQSVERSDISGNAGRVFDQGIAKIKYGMGHDVRKIAGDEAVKATSDRMAEAQGEAIMNNINNHIAKREGDAAEREEAERRKAKYLSDQQAAIRANQKETEKPAAPANNEPGNSAKTEAQNNMNERVEAGRAARAGAQGENASNKAGRPAPLVVHNAEERFQKNLEDVQGKLKYEPILEIIRKYQEEQQRLADSRTPEQKKKDARREKMAKIFAALGDGVAAMSNLVLTSKGAIPYQSKSMISRAVGDRYDKFSKDLENRKARYLELSEKIAKLQQGVEDSKAEDERLKAAQELAKAELAYKQYKDARDFDYNKDKDDRQFNYNKDKDDRQFNYNKGKDDKELAIKRQQANAATTNARANATRAATDRANGGRGTRYEFQGKTYGNKDAWGAAIKREATRLGIDLSEEYKTTDPLGRARKSERLKPIDQLLAEVNDKLAAQGGGSGSGNKGGKGKGY